MKFEGALNYLRLGYRIYRTSNPDKGSLCGTAEKPMGSFYLTLWDVLADDWDFVATDVFPKIENDLLEDCKIMLMESIEIKNIFEIESGSIKINVNVCEKKITEVINMLRKNLGPKNEQ